MTTTVTLKELKAKLKPLGFTINTKWLSFGRAGWVVRLSDKKQMPSMFMGPEDLARWQPAIDTITNIRLVDDDKGQSISGPWSGLRRITA